MENSKLKDLVNSSSQLTLQKKNLETIILDLEKSMKEKESRVSAIERLNTEYLSKIQDMEMLSSAHQKEVGKMVV